jgi:hypothetical protein
VLEHLLKDFRSAALRKQFFAHEAHEYTDTLDVKLLVRTWCSNTPSLTNSRRQQARGLLTRQLNSPTARHPDSSTHLAHAARSLTHWHMNVCVPLSKCVLLCCAVFFCVAQTGTYNVAGKKPPAGLRLHDWLDQWKHAWPKEAGKSPGQQAATADGPDIVAIGFQEVVPLSAGNVIAGPSSEGADAWDYVLAATLNGDDW